MEKFCGLSVPTITEEEFNTIVSQFNRLNNKERMDNCWCCGLECDGADCRDCIFCSNSHRDDINSAIKARIFESFVEYAKEHPEKVFWDYAVEQDDKAMEESDTAEDAAQEDEPKLSNGAEEACKVINAFGKLLMQIVSKDPDGGIAYDKLVETVSAGLGPVCIQWLIDRWKAEYKFGGITHIGVGATPGQAALRAYAAYVVSIYGQN